MNDWQVRFLGKRRIDFEAARLWAEFQLARRTELVPPVPVDELLELHCGLTLEVTNLCEQLGEEDVLGAIWFERREVVIDHQLDPEMFPEREGRYRFTLAHELGHWQLHRREQGQARRQAGRPAFICRSSSRERVEWQADYFAACLLLPRPLVYRAWRELNGGRATCVAQFAAARADIVQEEFLRRGQIPLTTREEDNYLLDAAAQPLAEQFGVSPTAMRIRLEELGLALR